MSEIQRNTYRTDRKQEMIQRIKDCGQYIIDNAEAILGNERYLRELYLTCNFFDITESPYITINKDVIPDSFIERFRNQLKLNSESKINLIVV